MEDVGALFYRPEKKRGGREVARADPDVEFSNGMPANPGDVSDDDSFEADSYILRGCVCGASGAARVRVWPGWWAQAQAQGQARWLG